MKAILGALVLVPLMEAFAAAQEPTADAKEGRVYLEAGLGFGVLSMQGPSTTTTGFDSIAEFALGFAAEFKESYVAVVWDRSGMGSRGIHRFGGVIDADWQ